MYDTTNITPEQARFFLEQAVKEGKVKGTDIMRYRNSIQDELTNLENRLASLRGASTNTPKSSKKTSAKLVATKPGVMGRPKGSTSKRATAATTPSNTDQTFDQQVITRYTDLIRHFPVAERPIYSKICNSSGRLKAIEAMEKAKGMEPTFSSANSNLEEVAVS